MMLPIFVDHGSLFTPSRWTDKSFNVFNDSPTPSLANTGVDITSTENEFCLSLDMPGIKPDDLDITVKDCGLVSITGIRRFNQQQGQTVKKARISKTFSVDAATVDLTQLKANLADGVLVVSAPKKPKPVARKIAVTTVPHSQTLGTEDPKEDKNSIEKENTNGHHDEEDGEDSTGKEGSQDEKQ